MHSRDVPPSALKTDTVNAAVSLVSINVSGSEPGPGTYGLTTLPVLLVLFLATHTP